MNTNCAVCKKGVGPTKCEICGFSDNGVINRSFENIEEANHWYKTVVNPYMDIFKKQINNNDTKQIFTSPKRDNNISSNSSLLKRQKEERKEKDRMAKYTGAGKSYTPYKGHYDIYKRIQNIVDVDTSVEARTRRAIMALGKDSILRKAYEAKHNIEIKEECKNENNLHTSPSQLTDNKSFTTNSEMIQKKEDDKNSKVKEGEENIMNFDELRRLSQEGQKNVENDLIQLCEKCNPKKIADIIMADIKKEALKAVKEGKYNAAVIFYFTSYQKNQHPNIQAMNKDVFRDLNIFLSYDKKVKLKNMLFEKVKSYITDQNI